VGEALSERRLELYRPVSVFTDPRSLDLVRSFSFPVQWPAVQDAIEGALLQRPVRSSRSRSRSRSRSTFR
jgi:hypothetical protein